LAHKTLHREAQAALRKVACDVTGQLIDALLNPHMDFVVRRRVPWVLALCATQRVADGLLLGIADERFEVRYECGRALLRVTQSNSEVVVSREKVFEAIRREVANWTPVTAGEFDEEASGTDSLAFVSDLLAKDRLNRRLEHIFTILSMHLEREPLRMAFRALHHEDQRHRGTALEYLQTVLPSELRDAVWPTLSEQGPLPEPRPTQQILDDLARATSALTRKSA
jgi:AAA family ATP:ADP antiporter